MSNHPLEQFHRQSYLNLETFRKTGEGVQTPVWFVENGGLLYVETFARAGKVKRIRRNPRVRVVPCTASGSPRGTWVEGEARLVSDAAESEQTIRRLNRKYGLIKVIFEWVTRLRGRQEDSIIIAIQLKPTGQA
jgi:hypothetical protein